MHLGELEGQPKAPAGSLKRRYLRERTPSGESLHDVFLRAARFAERIERDIARGRTAPVVGHYWINRMVAGALAGAPFETIATNQDYSPSTGSVVEIEWAGRSARVRELRAGARQE